jgi:tetratricopeptide (TPR) repeat protein
LAAANSYRLAVQVTDDPAVRAAYEEVDAKARARTREVSVAAARAAEAGGRWPEASAKWLKAHGASPEPWIAERAGNAIRLEGGDLRRAAQLVEQAVLADPNNATYRVTLGEIYLDAGLMARAKGESGRAIALAPADPRALSLVKAVARVKG